MRAFGWRLRGAKIGRRTAIYAHSKVDRAWGFTTGMRSCVEQGVWIKLVADDATLSLGRHCFVGAFTIFDILYSVRVGDHTLIAPGCFITDHDHGMDPDSRIDDQRPVARSVTIGSDVWIGTGVKILKGVVIGDGAVIGAGAVVTRDVESNEICAGVPARAIGRRGTRERTKHSRSG